MSFKTALVTVGSTHFEELVKIVDTKEFAQVLMDKGFERLIIQYGPKGEYEPLYLLEQYQEKKIPLIIEIFRMSSTFGEILMNSSLVISHAGAGTILEGLKQKIKMIVVVNDKLMDNHQMEIADAMAEKGYVLQTSPNNLLNTFATANFDTLVEFPPSKTYVFASYIDQVMGF